MFQHYFYAVFFDRFFFLFVEIDIEIDDVMMTFVENCFEMKTITIIDVVVLIETVIRIEATFLIENDVAAKIDVSITVEIIKNNCKKTSTNLNAIVKNFLSRRVDDLLIRFVLFFLINSRCSNFFIKFKQLFKYDINLYSLNFEL